MCFLKIAVDASNLKAGGGLTHLKQISVYFDKEEDIQFDVFGGTWINQLKNSNKHIYTKEFSSIYQQEKFKLFTLPLKLEEFDLVFAPGGAFSSKKVAYVTMCRNMLVFEEKERNRFPLSFNKLRYILLEKIQIKSYLNSKAIIYISEYAKYYVESKYPQLKSKKSIVIYHGISDNFRQKPKPQQSIDTYTKSRPFKITYISIINFYKHQWNVVQAIKKLKTEGYNIELDLIGSMYPPAKKRFENALEGTQGFVNYMGVIPYEEIANSYKIADVFVFASTCENMPNILVEAMSAGLPILSSNYGPMPEILKDGGMYMDPTKIESIYNGLKLMLENEDLRSELANKAYNYSKSFSWDKTAKQTFNFIKEIAQENKTQ